MKKMSILTSLLLAVPLVSTAETLKMRKIIPIQVAGRQLWYRPDQLKIPGQKSVYTILIENVKKKNNHDFSCTFTFITNLRLAVPGKEVIIDGKKTSQKPQWQPKRTILDGKTWEELKKDPANRFVFATIGKKKLSAANRLQKPAPTAGSGAVIVPKLSIPLTAQEKNWLTPDELQKYNDSKDKKTHLPNRKTLNKLRITLYERGVPGEVQDKYRQLITTTPGKKENRAKKIDSLLKGKTFSDNDLTLSSQDQEKLKKFPNQKHTTAYDDYNQQMKAATGNKIATHRIVVHYRNLAQKAPPPPATTTPPAAEKKWENAISTEVLKGPYFTDDEVRIYTSSIAALGGDKLEHVPEKDALVTTMLQALLKKIVADKEHKIFTPEKIKFLFDHLNGFQKHVLCDPYLNSKPPKGAPAAPEHVTSAPKQLEAEAANNTRSKRSGMLDGDTGSWNLTVNAAGYTAAPASRPAPRNSPPPPDKTPIPENAQIPDDMKNLCDALPPELGAPPPVPGPPAAPPGPKPEAGEKAKKKGLSDYAAGIKLGVVTMVPGLLVGTFFGPWGVVGLGAVGFLAGVLIKTFTKG